MPFPSASRLALLLGRVVEPSQAQTFANHIFIRIAAYKLQASHAGIVSEPSLTRSVELSQRIGFVDAVPLKSPARSVT